MSTIKLIKMPKTINNILDHVLTTRITNHDYNLLLLIAKKEKITIASLIRKTIIEYIAKENIY